MQRGLNSDGYQQGRFIVDPALGANSEHAVRDDITSPIGPNANYGPVTISAGTTALLTLNPTASPLVNYYVYGGIVDLPLDVSQQQTVKTAPLKITAPNPVAGKSLNAIESIYRVYADQRNVYLEDYPNGLTINLQVRWCCWMKPA